MGIGTAVFITYQNSKEANPTLLELHTNNRGQILSEKKSRVDNIGIQLFYEFEEEKKEVSSIGFEVFHGGNGQIHIIEFSGNVKVEVGQHLYRKLTAYYPKMPQIFPIKQMPEIFGADWDWIGQRIIDDYFGVDTSSYTVFEEKQMSRASKLEQEIKESFAQEDLTAWIKKTYQGKKTNLSAKKRAAYMKEYQRLQINQIKILEINVQELTEETKVDLVDFQVKVKQLMN